MFGLILIDPVRFWCRCRGLALPFGVNYLSSMESHGPDQAWWVAKPGLGRMEKRRLHCSTESTLPPSQKRRLHTVLQRLLRSAESTLAPPQKRRLHIVLQLNLHLYPVQSCAFQKRDAVAQLRKSAKLHRCLQWTGQCSAMYLYLQ